MPRQIGDDKQQIAHFLADLGWRQAVARLDQFARFFADLVDHLIGRGPVEPDPRRPLLQLDRPQQCRQSYRHPIQDPALVPGSAFGGLDPFPIHRLLPGALVAGLIAEHMRVPRHHLVGNRGDHRGKAEMPGLGPDLGVIDGLQQQIAQFALQVAPVLPFNGIRHFMGFFDRIAGNRGKVLHQIPGAAAVGIPQPRHDFQQPPDPGSAVLHQRIAGLSVFRH